MTTETLATGSESTFLYRFLVSPDLRWMRYLVLILVLGTISFNQVFIIFLDYKDILGGWIYTFTFLYPAHLCSGYLLESFPTLSEIFIEETLSDLFVIAFYCDDRSSVDTDVNRIHVIFLLAGTPCARFLFFDAHGSGLYFFFYVIYAVYDRRYDDSSSERVDD